MNDRDLDLADRVARLQRRVNVLTFWLALACVLAVASGALGAWHAMDARVARKEEIVTRRKIEYLELRLRAHAAQADPRLQSLEREVETARLELRRGEFTAVRRWMTRADRAQAEARARIESLERRLPTPDSARDSLDR